MLIVLAPPLLLAITLHEVAHGWVASRCGDTTAKAQGRSREQFAEERQNTVPMGRIGDPQELGDACAFLCSARSGYITGQNLLLDGGLFNSAF